MLQFMAQKYETLRCVCWAHLYISLFKNEENICTACVKIVKLKHVSPSLPRRWTFGATWRGGPAAQIAHLIIHNQDQHINEQTQTYWQILREHEHTEAVRPTLPPCFLCSSHCNSFVWAIWADLGMWTPGSWGFVPVSQRSLGLCSQLIPSFRDCRSESIMIWAA